MCGGPTEYITYEFVPASPAVSCMSGSSNLKSFRDKRQVAVLLVSCGVLPPWLPAERTNVVNIGAFLNRYGLVMSFSSIFLSERNGFNVCFNRRSRPCHTRY